MNLFSIGTSSDSSFYSKSHRKHSKNGCKSKIHRRTSSAWKSFSVCTCGRPISSSPQPKRSYSTCTSAKLQEKTENEVLAKARTTLENSSAQYSSGDLAEVPFEVIETEDILLWGCPPPKIPRLNFEDNNRELFLSVINENTKLVPAYCKGRKFLTSGTNISLRSSTSSKPMKPWTPPEDQVSVNHDYSTPDFDAPDVIRWEDWSPLGLDDVESLTEVQKFVGCNSDSRSSICEIFDVTDTNQVHVLSQRPISSQYSLQNKSSSAIIEEFSSSNDCTPSQTQDGNVKITELNPSSLSGDLPTPKTTSSASFTRFLFQDELLLTDNKLSPPQPFQDENKNYEYGLEDMTDDPINIFTATNDELYQPDAINIQLFHSLPVLYATVLNIGDDECEFCQTKSKERLEQGRRRKAASVSFFNDQQLFESGKTFEIPGDDCYMSLSEMLDTCHIEEITDKVADHSEKEIFEVYKSTPLNSSSSKVPLKLSSFMGANRPKSAPSASISLLSFSPEDSFATKLEEVTEGVTELSLTKCCESKDEPVSVEKLDVGGSDSKKSFGSIEVKGVCSKFYPPPTPIKSVKTCRRQGDEKFMKANGNNTAVVCNLLLDTSVSAPLKLETKKRSMTSEDYLNQNEFFNSEENMVGTIVDCAKFSSAASPESLNNLHDRDTIQAPEDIPTSPQKSSSMKVLAPAVVTETCAIPNITAPERKISVKPLELSKPAVTESLCTKSSSATALNSAITKSSRPQKPRKSVKKKIVPKHNDEYYSTKNKVLEESAKDGDLRKRRHRHPRKKHATSSEDCTDTTRTNFKPRICQAKECPDLSSKTKKFESTGSDDDLESSESANYKRRKKRKKKRRTLWQRMMQYFFGCSSARRSYDNLDDSPPARFYGSDYKPSISLFERIVIWWRRKSHRQVVVRQDSLEMFRIKRRKWLSEMNEFCEDCRVVTKNVREAEPGKYYHKPLQLPRARVVNSEGCVLFGDKLDNLDIVNANKTEIDKKGRCRKPVKSILKNGSKPAEKPLRSSKTKKR